MKILRESKRFDKIKNFNTTISLKKIIVFTYKFFWS